jgi:hypothetical protein
LSDSPRPVSACLLPAGPPIDSARAAVRSRGLAFASLAISPNTATTFSRISAGIFQPWCAARIIGGESQ